MAKIFTLFPIYWSLGPIRTTITTIYSTYSEPGITFRGFQFSQFCSVMLFCACMVLSSIPCLQLLDTSSIPHLWQPQISADIAEYLLGLCGDKTAPGENHYISPFECIIYLLHFLQYPVRQVQYFTDENAEVQRSCTCPSHIADTC